MSTILALLIELEGGTPAEVAGYGARTVESLERERVRYPMRQVEYDFRAGALRIAQVVDVPEDTKAAEREIAVVFRRDFDDTVRQARADIAREVLQAVHEFDPLFSVRAAARQIAEQYGVTL